MVIKNGGWKVSVVMGEYITMDQIIDLSKHTLGIKFLGRRVGVDCLLRSIEAQWHVGLGYIMVTQYLSKLWLNFIFKFEEDVFFGSK